MDVLSLIYSDDSAWDEDDAYLVYRYLARYVGNLDKPVFGYDRILRSLDFSKVGYKGRILMKCVLSDTPAAIPYLNRPSLKALRDTKPNGTIIRLSNRMLEQSPYKKWGVII